MLPTGADFLSTFMGILLAGAVPVPLYPPFRTAGLEDYPRRQAGILDNAAARLLVTVDQVMPVARVLRGTAGRRMSRTAAKKSVRNRSLRKEFQAMGIEVRAACYATVAEEVPEAYKDVAEVVDVVHGAGIGKKVARLHPMGVLKG